MASLIRKSAQGLAVLLCSALPLAAIAAADHQRAVVLVSGTAATTPFTTPNHACKQGFSAGNTWTYLRENLSKRGYRVFTAPASIGGSKVKATSDPMTGPFRDCPEQLPAAMTINSIGTVDQSGANLARLIQHLNHQYGVTKVDLVGHSLGGVIGRAAIRELRLNRIAVQVSSYSTIGSPWDGTQIAVIGNPQQQLEGCDGEPSCSEFVNKVLPLPGIEILTATLSSKNAPVWNSYQIGVLDGIPVTMIAGTYLSKANGDPKRWPNDGVIEESSAFGVSTSDAVLPHRRCIAFALTHSLSVSQALRISDATSLTWNPEVADALSAAFDNAKVALKQPNRLGCPRANASIIQ